MKTLNRHEKICLSLHNIIMLINSIMVINTIACKGYKYYT